MVPDVLQMMILPVNSVNVYLSFKRFEVHFVKASRILEGVKTVASLVSYMNNNRLSVSRMQSDLEKKTFRSRPLQSLQQTLVFQLNEKFPLSI